MKNLLFTFSYKLKNVLNEVGSLGSVGAQVAWWGGFVGGVGQ